MSTPATQLKHGRHSKAAANMKKNHAWARKNKRLPTHRGKVLQLATFNPRPKK